jgi:TRAP-type transport system periplasmic protein
VPELGFVDLPFLFSSNAQARAAMDGELGALLIAKTEERADLRVLGWLENGFRHISNRLRPVHVPADMKGMRIRVLPSEVQKRTFELLGAVAQRLDLSEAIAMIKSGSLDAQENPLANTVTYGVHNFHKFHTLTSHFYISRPVFVHRAAYDAWPDELRRAIREAVREAVTFQRKLALAEQEQARRIIAEAGCTFVTPTPAEHARFVDAVQPLLAEARETYGEAMFGMVPKP